MPGKATSQESLYFFVTQHSPVVLFREIFLALIYQLFIKLLLLTSARGTSFRRC